MSIVAGCKRKLKTGTITEKYKILKKIEKGESSASISKKYGVPEQTSSGGLKEKQNFIQKSRKTKLLRKESGCDSSHMRI